jgi:hypothetical protein
MPNDSTATAKNSSGSPWWVKKCVIGPTRAASQASGRPCE